MRRERDSLGLIGRDKWEFLKSCVACMDLYISLRSIELGEKQFPYEWVNSLYPMAITSTDKDCE